MHVYQYKLLNVLDLKCSFKSEQNLLSFVLSSTYIRKKYWIPENFQLPVFNGFTCFEMS